MAIVTLSRQLASGGDAIARIVGQALDLRVVDQGVINQAAIEAGVPRVAIAELGYEGQRSLVERILRVVYEMPAIPTTLESQSKDTSAGSGMFGTFLSPLHRSMSVAMRDYVRMTDMVVRDLAREGQVIVVGRGGQVVLRDMPGVLHVQVVASFPRRINVLMERENIDRREADTRLRASDRARAEYLQRYYGINWSDSTFYDLVINTDYLSLPMAVGAVVGACQAQMELCQQSASSETMGKVKTTK